MRRRIPGIFIFAVVLLWGAAAWPSRSISLTLLHTNDTHGHLLPFSYPETVAQGSEAARLTSRRNIGGIARRATLVNRIRAELGAGGVTVWLVDIGDFSEGTPFSIEYRGEADVAAMNAVGYDFAALGNHEFGRSLAQTRKLIDLADYPILCANAVAKAENRLLAEAYAVRKIGALKIALFGLLTREAGAYPAARRQLAISDPLKTGRRMVDQLKSEADILIALSHCGDEVDQRIAANIEEIDVIVGGHSHSRLPSGKFVWHGEEPKPHDVNGTILVQNHQWGGELGRLDLRFGRNERGEWHVEQYRAQLIPVTDDLPAEPAVAAVVQHFWQPIAGRYGEVIGRATADFVTHKGDLLEYNLVADAIRATFKTDLVLENIGGIRSPLIKGPLTRADLVAMDPFENTVVTFKIQGSRLKRLLREEKPAVSGLRYRVTGRVLKEASCAGEPLADDRFYHGATNSFFARKWLKDIHCHDTGRQRLDVLSEYIRSQGSVTPVRDGRRKLR